MIRYKWLYNNSITCQLINLHTCGNYNIASCHSVEELAYWVGVWTMRWRVVGMNVLTL